LEDVCVVEIVEDEVRVPELHLVAELPVSKEYCGRLDRETLLGLIYAMKRELNQDPWVIEGFVLSQIAGLPTLLIGPHGSGKTTLAKVFFSTLYKGKERVRWKYINVKEIQTEYTVYARPHFGKLVKGIEEWVPVAINYDAVFIDEVFRNPRVFAALNEILEEGTFEGLNVKWKFVVAATNPPNMYYRNIEMLNYADLDRFASIIYVEDVDMDFADKIASGCQIRIPCRLDISNIDDVRRKISSLGVLDEALTFAKILVGAFSVCRFEPVDGEGKAEMILNKFGIVGDLKCYRCIFQKHRLCSRYAVAPKRAFRSLISLAKARAWVLYKKEVDVSDVMWAFRFTVPGRTAIISQELKEKCPTYGELYRRMFRDFRKWYLDNIPLLKRLDKVDSTNDPVLQFARRIIKPTRVLKGYRVVIDRRSRSFEKYLKRLMKWFIIGGVSSSRTVQMMEKIKSNITVLEMGLRIVPQQDAVIVEAFKRREEAEKLCSFLKD